MASKAELILAPVRQDLRKEKGNEKRRKGMREMGKGFRVIGSNIPEHTQRPKLPLYKVKGCGF